MVSFDEQSYILSQTHDCIGQMMGKVINNDVNKLEVMLWLIKHRNISRWLTFLFLTPFLPVDVFHIVFL